MALLFAGETVVHQEVSPSSVSIVIPARPESQKPAALNRSGKASLLGDGNVAEVIVTRGYSPSAQRNAAVRASAGDVLLFLDDDSDPSPGLVDLYSRTFQKAPALAAMGGPAETCARTRFERIVGLVLGEPLVMGRSASRYRALGKPRAADERELILCNLAVRRSAFEAAGGFDENLYPNEENRFLEVLKERGFCLFYDPGAKVTRPAPESPLGFLKSVFGYGRGRMRQAQRSLSRITALRLFLASALFVALTASIATAMWVSLAPLASLAMVAAAYLVAVATRLFARSSMSDAALGSLLAVTIHAAYALGILSGLFRRVRSPAREIHIQRYLPLGEGGPHV